MRKIIFVICFLSVSDVFGDKRVLDLTEKDPILSSECGEKITKIVYSDNGIKEISCGKNEKKT